MDLAPTALSLLGVEVPRDMDGQALEDHFLLAPAEKVAR
jgi:arylsulfatase A-like enzyme